MRLNSKDRPKTDALPVRRSMAAAPNKTPELGSGSSFNRTTRYQELPVRVGKPSHTPGSANSARTPPIGAVLRLRLPP